jgi:Raf kinase inhibitor-like YbhB/YbcL family protein
MPLRLSSEAFEPDGMLPARYTCEAENVSPPLRIAGVPKAAQSLALIVDDPDAPNGAFTHWVLYNLPADLDQLAEGFQSNLEDTRGPAEGRNDFGSDSYDGPCPPAGGEPHTYYFRLYALDQRFTLPAGATRAQVLDAMQGHLLAQTELMARFGRDAVPAEQLGQGTRGWDYEFYAEIPDLTEDAEHRLRAETEQRLGELTRGHQDMTGASVAVEPVAAAQDQEPIRFRARVVAYIRPDNLAVVEQDDSAELALGRALDVIERRVREHRAKLREQYQQHVPSGPGPLTD